MEYKDDEILDNLYRKHRDNNAERLKIESAIIAFGGTIPVYMGVLAKALETYTPYPKAGTWKDKILYALTKGPASAEVISKAIYKEEPTLNPDKILMTVTQYCSAMGSTGELSKIREGKKYIYSLIK